MALRITIVGMSPETSALGLALGTLPPDALANGRPAITGWDADAKLVREARDRLFVDAIASSLEQAVSGADLILISDANANAVLLGQIVPLLRDGTIVAFAGGSQIAAEAEAARALPTSVSVIGCHPLSELPVALRDIKMDTLRGANIAVTPSASAHPSAVDAIAALVEAIGAKPFYLDATEYDAYVATLRQIPLLLHAALLEAATRTGGWRDMRPLATDGFRAAVRLSGEVTDLTAHALTSNRAALTARLNDLIELLGEFRAALENPDQLDAMLEHTAESYRDLLQSRPHQRPGENELLGQGADLVQQRGLGSMLLGSRRPRKK